MGIDVEELVIQPFREVVERGKEAIANAEASDHDHDAASSGVMVKSARALVKEGERALQKLTPLWQSQVDKHGDAFKEALRYNDGIIDSQRHLEDLLYDLDDFVQVESFDKVRFAQVQAASKTYALALLETVKRMRIEDSSIWPYSPQAPSMSTPSDGSIPTLPLSKQQQGTSDRGGPFPGCGSAYQDSVGTASRKPSSLDILGAERDCISLVPEPTNPSYANPRPATSGSRISAWVREQTSGTGFWPIHNTIPECDPYIGHIVNGRGNSMPEGADALVPKPLSVPYSPVTACSRSSSFTGTGSFDSGHRSSSNIPTSDQRNTSLGWPLVKTASEEYSEESNALLPPLFRPNSESALEHEPIPIYEDGLIPVDELLVRQKSLTTGFQIGLDSSLYLQKGFCAGAHKYRAKGTKAATKSVMEYGSRRTIARCVDCEFAQSMLEVELDTLKSENSTSVSKLMLQTKLPISGNMSKAGVYYRLRFLYKSHMISATAFTAQYGCLFCAQKGYTVHADDATVFAHHDQLFAHLARHPQPLPEVPGVTVLYGELAEDDPQKDDYDLHFPHGPVASPLPDAAALAALPTGVATKPHVKRYGRELEDPDGGSGGDVLKFAEGARIVGIEFPDRWKGRWCTGWHDGAWGSFPAKLVALEAPGHLPAASAPGAAGGGSMMVTTRWRWEGKDPATGWLPFDKEETIFNVSWLNQDDWCWSGRRKDGRAGLFPRSHVKVETLRDENDFHDDEVDSLDRKTKKLSFGLHGLPAVRIRRMTIGSHTS
ncbi:hypothetical protein F4775DRAFT_556058 [Biscogniauxia sp. FL1348]|nr:hypothetical protein F4775DRAFT_556058 [Biscogniauxia sp. FL1348]